MIKIDQGKIVTIRQFAGRPTFQAVFNAHLITYEIPLSQIDIARKVIDTGEIVVLEHPDLLPCSIQNGWEGRVLRICSEVIKRRGKIRNVDMCMKTVCISWEATGTSTCGLDWYSIENMRECLRLAADQVDVEIVEYTNIPGMNFVRKLEV